MSTGPAYASGFAAGNFGTVQLERTLGMPAEGPKCLPLTIDFTLQDSYLLDYGNQQRLGYFAMLQTVFVDTSTSAVELQIRPEGSQQVLKIKGGTQGYYPILAPNPLRIHFDCPGGPADIRVTLMNFPVAPGQWAV